METAQKTPVELKILLRYCVRETMGLAMMGAALFWAAGTMRWWQGWAVLAVMFLWTAATLFVILRTNPSLLRERLGPRKGAKTWDTAIMSLLGLIQLVKYIIAGLDHRHTWSGDFALAVQLAALVVCLLGYAVVAWSTHANAFFSQIVRLQTERGQTVISDGPYALVRHPAYLGALVYELASPLLLGSWWALLPGAVCAVLLLIRTRLEDRTLQTELPGYGEYAQKTRWKLFPGVW